MNTTRMLLTQFSNEVLAIIGIMLLIVSALIVAIWVYNKKRYQKLVHQIPASVVKNYLDSIIQNSTSLKSSLFRGGGLDMGEGIPSVKPVSDMSSGAVEVRTDEEGLRQRDAKIASLEGQLAEKTRLVTELEAKIKELEAMPKAEGGDAELVAKLNTEIEDLKAKLAAAEAAKASAEAAAGEGGGDSAQLDEISKERDELKERLQEYEIIEDDLANLKRLQQENEQLKKQLEGSGGAAAPTEEAPAAEAAPAAEPEAAAEPAPEPEAVAEPEPVDVAQIEEAVEEEPAAEAAPVAEEAPAAEAAPAGEEAPAEEKSGEDVPELENNKSAEDLLSEFEKMLG